MMQMVPKWKVVATFADGREVSIWVSDTYLSNVLRTVATIDFAQGAEQPISILVGGEQPQPQTLTSAAVVGGTFSGTDCFGNSIRRNA